MKRHDPEWEGYTLDEIRFRRILTTTRMELEKSALASHTAKATSLSATAGNMWSRITGALNYMDYAILAFNVGKRIFSLFRKKKR